MTKSKNSILSWLKNSIYWQLSFRLILVMCFYMLFRVFFLLYNYSYFNTLSGSRLAYIFQGSVQFDLSAVLYSNLLLILLCILPIKIKYNKYYQKTLSIIFYVFNIICLLLNSIDIVYYRFSLKRTTSTIFTEFGNNKNTGKVLFSSIVDYWPVTIITLLLIALFIYIAKKSPKVKVGTESNWKFYTSQAIAIPVIMILVLGGLRGGLAHSVRPITLSNAARYINNGNDRALVLNTPFALFRTLDKKNLKEVHYYDNAELRKHCVIEYPATPGTLKGKKKLNVVVFLLESFGRGYVGAFNKDIPGYKSYTPFLDSLCQHAMIYKNAFANGHQSIEAMPSVICSIPSIKEPFITSSYSADKVNSLPILLKKQGYYSAFFHGATNGSMGFDAFAKQAGYNDYFGRTEFNDESQSDGYWGIWDEPFLQFFSKKLSTFKEPFFGTIFTLSSHHPFKIPEKYVKKFPEGKVPLQKCIKYSDNALRRFFDKSKNEPWFKNTIFVFSADHGTFTPIPKYKTSAGIFAIPLIFYTPGGQIKPGFNDSTYVEQIDVMPTLLNLIGTPHKYISFGNDINNKLNRHYVFNYSGGFFQLIKDDYILLFDGKKSQALYNIVKDPLQKDNLVNKRKDVVAKLEPFVKSLVQEYSARLINNNLTIKE